MQKKLLLSLILFTSFTANNLIGGDTKDGSSVRHRPRSGTSAGDDGIRAAAASDAKPLTAEQIRKATAEGNKDTIRDAAEACGGLTACAAGGACLALTGVTMYAMWLTKDGIYG